MKCELCYNRGIITRRMVKNTKTNQNETFNLCQNCFVEMKEGYDDDYNLELNKERM